MSVGPAVLTGVAMAAPVMAWTARLEKETGLANLFRFVVVPMFLFSGTFFPVSQLPDWIEWLAWITPLARGGSRQGGCSPRGDDHLLTMGQHLVPSRPDGDRDRAALRTFERRLVT